ncbi:MAG: rhomboid family intramembrane serine protease [Cytophagaceae bacterium]|jgi:membrane associated rhomboid family serine protease|nr:rhomboid family intramembrane serine protease [Cytophagaceae bacterium]
MSLTLLIIIITGAVSMLAFNNSDWMSKGIMNPYVIKRRQQWYRMITSGFLHADYIHLLFNMMSLYFLGSLVETVFNPIQYLTLYLGAMVISDIPTYFKYQDQPGYSSLGASGAVSAVVFSFIMMNPFEYLLVFFFPVPAILYGVFFLGYSYYLDKQGHGIINHSAHFYGAVTGIVFTAVIHPWSVSAFWVHIQSYFM